MKKNNSNFVTLVSVSLATFLGGVVRFYPVLLANFPLNDGGLFYQMTQDILNHNFALPLYTSYNGNVIPFAYPPLPFYLMAFLQRFLHIGIIDQLHYLPAFFSILCIPTLYFLSKRVTGSSIHSVFAVFAYALIPQSYLWLIMGGGATRALGILFGMLALIFIWEMFKEPRYASMLLAILFSSLEIYSHLGYAWFLLLTSVLIFIKFGFTKKRVLHAVLTAAGVLILTAPWWVSIIQRYGISLFFNASQAGDLLDISIILFNFTGEPFAQILAVIALLGLFAELARRHYFLLAWLLLISIFSARGGQRLATIPGSMLFGAGIAWVVVPGLLSFTRKLPEESQQLIKMMQVGMIKFIFGFILFYAFFSALTIPLLGLSETRSLSQFDRQAMEWVAQNTTSDSKYAILTGEQWITDPLSEWFPALSGRISVATVQGSEWLPDHGYSKLIDKYEKLQSCADKDYLCILNWEKENNISLNYLAITKKNGGKTGVSQAAIVSFVSSGNLHLVLDNPKVSIFQVADDR